MTETHPPTPWTLLVDCPLWATMHWVPLPVMTRLERNIAALRKRGCRAQRADVVGARIIASPPPAAELALELERYRRRYAEALAPGGQRAALMLRLPSPASLLLDALVADVRQLNLPAYRHEVIGALILNHDPRGVTALARAFDEYRRVRVGEMTSPLLPSESLLTTARPNQGPRPR